MTATVEGLDRTIRTLEQIPRRAGKSVLRKAARAGGGEFVKAVRQEVPTGNKTLKRSITQVVRSYGGLIMSVIGQNRNAKGAKRIKRSGGISGRGDVVPIHFIEEGTKPHEITGNPWLSFGGRVVRRVMHPGTRGQHPVRKGAARGESAAVRAFATKAEQAATAEFAKISGVS